MKKVVAAIQQGDTVIVENCPEDIDAALNPVLQRAVIRRGSNLFLRMGGEDCEYDPRFRLYLQSRLSNPKYRPEVFATCTLINFIVTERWDRGKEPAKLELFVYVRMCCARHAHPDQLHRHREVG